MSALHAGDNIVLQAPTGAGKTTIVPLAALDSGLMDGKILVLQPRRLTCIMVAQRMAALWGEPLGETVGYKIRHEGISSPRTRIEVITEGVLTRMLLMSPTLEGVSAIFFDEFHERSMESDVGFTLCLEAKIKRNLPVRFVVMSATFQGLGDRVAALLGEKCRVLDSEGRTYPVTSYYKGVLDVTNWQPDGPQKFSEVMAKVIADALEEHREGDVLVFLPGEREIMYTWISLNNIGIGDGKKPRQLVAWADRLIDKSVDLSSCRVEACPLYGTMDTREQQEALKPPAPGCRKVILASPVAESSITVPGIKVVIDAGLRKVKSEDRASCTSVMETIPVSLASADQRAGRAGRVSPGTCYRLWSEAQHRTLLKTDRSELLRSDLSGVVLELAFLGVLSDEEIHAMPWVDKPEVEALADARKLLLRIRALKRLEDGSWAVTERGRRLTHFPANPRIAHMILQACSVSESTARDACDLAALLEEKELLKGGRMRNGADLKSRIKALQDPSNRNVIFQVSERVRSASEQMQRIAGLNYVASFKGGSERRSWGILVAWAFPEMVAKNSGGGRGGQRGDAAFRLFSGPRVYLPSRDQLSRCEFLACASVTGSKVFWALETTEQELSTYGFDINDPMNHEVFETDERIEEKAVVASGDARLTSVQRYLLEAGCMDVSSADDFLEALASRFPARFMPSTVTAMLWDMARESKPQVDLLLRVLEEVVVPGVRHFSVCQLAQMACVMAVSKARSQQALHAIARAITPRLSELPLDGVEGNLSGLLWGFTACRISTPELSQGVAEIAVQALVDFQPKVLSDVRKACFWSFRRESAGAWSDRAGQFEDLRVSFASREFYAALAPMVARRLDEIAPISCVYLMWSYSKAGISAPELFDAIAARVGPTCPELDRCGLTMFLWNYACSGINNKEVLQWTADDTLRPDRMAEMAPRDVSCIAWALQRLHVHHEELLTGLLRHSVGLLKDGLQQECYRSPSKSLARPVYVGDFSAKEGAVDAFDMGTMGDVLRACAHFQRSDDYQVDEEFLDLSEEYLSKALQQSSFARKRFCNRNAQTTPTALLALAKLRSDRDMEPFFLAALPALREQLPQMNGRVLALLIEAWARGGPRDHAFVEEMDQQLARGNPRMVRGVASKDLHWAVEELGMKEAKRILKSS